MGKRFPTFKDGDAIEPWMWNLVFRELERWSELRGSGLIAIDGADSNAPPTIVDYREDGGLVRIWMPTGIAAGTFGTPGHKTDAIIAVRSGDGWTTTGGTTIDHLYNSDTTAVTGAKAGWAVRRDDGSGYDLVVADC